VVRLTEAIHEELRRAKSPVKVSCLCPGPTATAYNDNSGVKVSGKQIPTQQAAREGVDGALAGKMIVIPGRKMPFVVGASRLMGEHLSTMINYSLQVKKAGK
jgi:short-subunit dehydrogenase